MFDKIQIQLMNHFVIYINEEKVDHLVDKSRKGASLMQILIMNRGESVPNLKLMGSLWSEEKSSNPEQALKTLVSRMRSLLNQVYDGLGGCIVAERGAYRWQCMPGMEVDVYQIEDIFDQLKEDTLDETTRRKLMEQLLDLFAGDLLLDSEQSDWALSMATSLHNRYLSAVYGYLDSLKQDEDYDRVITVCRKALEVDNLDDRLHMELMNALIKTERNNEAMLQYKYVTHLYYHYLGVRPSDNMQEFYTQIVNSGKTLDLNLESIRNELRESNESRGAFICEYMVFKEIFNLQMRNLERLGSTMFLGVIMISSMDGSVMEPMRQDNIMQGLIEILRQNLRKGDTVSRFSPTIVALLLPMVNYHTGRMVMERIKSHFYKKYPNCSVAFSYRIGPLSSEAGEPRLPESAQN